MIAHLPSCYSPSFLRDLSLLRHGWRVAASLPPLWPANGTTRHSYLQGTLLGSVPGPYRKFPTSCWLYCLHSRPHPHHYLPPRRLDRDPHWSPVFSPTFPFSLLQSPLSKVIRSLSCSATSDAPPPSAGKCKSIMWPVQDHGVLGHLWSPSSPPWALSPTLTVLSRCCATPSTFPSLSC